MNKYQTVYLREYTASNYLVDNLSLVFELSEDKTLVKAKTRYQKNPHAKFENKLALDGEKLTLIKISLNNKELSNNKYELTDSHLILKNLPDSFDLYIETEIHPEKNTELTGLYKSNTMFCTQCEAQGFRRITYFLDRPDVMTKYTTKIIADKTRYPVLLSNGNPIAQGDLANNLHFVEWEDPFKKPSYLFALVAGNLDCLRDEFITMSGRKIDLRIYIEKGNLDKTQHAMYSVKQAMKWDEETFGREYDLDIYMIVAVSDFNMGAMENKGLNIFNTKYVLANSAIATDVDYENILAVIGHEYFHNWSGNRVTCRDWFQLSLKEGLTIYRDQEFTADMTSRAVKRIKDVRNLRTFQFSEDAGPMAHPVRPESYIEINNFYTHTVYEKGAEVIRMIKTMVGEKGFRQGMDLYFARNDGHAVTIEDFVKAMEDANKIDLTQFRLWYSQAGTPVITINSSYDATKQEYHLKIKQSCPVTPDKLPKKPYVIPIVMSLLNENGQVINLDSQSRENKKNVTLILKEAEEQFVFKNIKEKPVPVLLHDFSAPVKLNMEYSDEEFTNIIMNSTDYFCRWEALQQYFINKVQDLVMCYREGKELQLPKAMIHAISKNINDSSLDRAFISELLSLPTEKYICSNLDTIDIDAIHKVRKFIIREIATTLQAELLNMYHENYVPGHYHQDRETNAKRQLKNTALPYLMALDNDDYAQMCLKQYYTCDNMTDRIAALSAIVNSKYGEAQECLKDFYHRYESEALVIDRWFTIQALSDHVKTFEQVVSLTKHPAFNINNPNRVRSLLGAFSVQNTSHFHRDDGAGYELLIDYVIKLNSLNPQVAARMMEPLSSWRHFDEKRQILMQKQLQRLRNTANLSSDVFEIVSKYLA